MAKTKAPGTTNKVKRKLEPPKGRVSRLVPCDNRVIVEQLAAPEKVGSIHLPDASRTPPKVGKVLETGPDTKQLQQGDWIVFEPYAGTTCEFFGQTAMVMPEDQVLFVIEVEERA